MLICFSPSKVKFDIWGWKYISLKVRFLINIFFLYYLCDIEEITWSLWISIFKIENRNFIQVLQLEDTLFSTCFFANAIQGFILSFSLLISFINKSFNT